MKIVYIANDGKQFDTQDECAKHDGLFIPKDGQICYSPCLTNSQKSNNFRYDSRLEEYRNMLRNGIVFATKQEAMACTDAIHAFTRERQANLANSKKMKASRTAAAKKRATR